MFMAYLITKTDGTVLGQVQAQTSNSSLTSLTLIGQGLSNYGQVFNDNMVALLENFSDTVAPIYPIKGQLWYNKGTSVLNYYDGSVWNVLASETWATNNFVTTTVLSNYATLSVLEASYVPTTSLSNYVTQTQLTTALGDSGNLAGYVTIISAAQTYAPLLSPSFSGNVSIPTPVFSTTGSYAINQTYLTTALTNYISTNQASNEFASLTSPTFTGNVTVPTPTYSSTGNYAINQTYLTTALSSYVSNTQANLTYLSIVSASQNYVSIVSANQNYAPIVSPSFSGIPLAPNPAATNNSSQIATTSFVNNFLQSQFASSLITNGYERLPNGFYIMWGYDTGGSIGPGAISQRTINFPIAFPNNCFSVSLGTVTANGGFYNIQRISRTNFTGYFNNNTTLQNTFSCYWMAVGN